MSTRFWALAAVLLLVAACTESGSGGESGTHQNGETDFNSGEDTSSEDSTVDSSEDSEEDEEETETETDREEDSEEEPVADEDAWVAPGRPDPAAIASAQAADIVLYTRLAHLAPA